MKTLTNVIVAIALATSFLACGGKKPEEKPEFEEVLPPAPPEELKDATGAYTYLITNWADGNFEEVYLACDTGTKETLGKAWDEYRSAKSLIYEKMEPAKAEDYFGKKDFGPLLRANGVQGFFAELVREDYTVAVAEDAKKAGFKITASEDAGENTKRFENNWIDVQITMAKEGGYWFTDYFRPVADDALGQAGLHFTEVNEDMGLF